MFHVKPQQEMLKKVCGQLELVVTDSQIAQLLNYAEMLREWNQKVHLISHKDQEKIIERHLIPSLYYVKYLSVLTSEKLRVLDVGSGGGLPGVVLSVLKPDWEVVLLDSSRKKTFFLRKVKENLGLGVQVVCERYEVFWKNDSRLFDWVVARAVAPLAELIDLLEPHLRQGSKLLTMKGLNFKDEMKGREFEGYNIQAWKLEPCVVDEKYLKNKCLVKVEKHYG